MSTDARSSQLAAVGAAIADYDAALRADDLARVDGWFLDSQATSRFGPSSVAYGVTEIAAGRRGRDAPGPPVDRIDGRRELVALGDDVVVATLEHRRPGSPERGRRTQVWWRTADGWRIAHAHLSVQR